MVEMIGGRDEVVVVEVGVGGGLGCDGWLGVEVGVG
jgi:hypothetical protein